MFPSLKLIIITHSLIILYTLFTIVKPEKVVNPYGSTAGAGSGEFHVYRHARAREMERLKGLDEAEREELLDKNFEQQVKQYKTEEEERTEKRRRKRKRQKEAKMRKKNLKLVGVSEDVGVEEKEASDKEEFTYIPVDQQKNVNSENEDDKATNESDAAVPKETNKAELPFASDGSFLEQMKRRSAAENESKQKEGEDDDEEDSRPKKKQEV